MLHLKNAQNPRVKMPKNVPKYVRSTDPPDKTQEGPRAHNTHSSAWLTSVARADRFIIPSRGRGASLSREGRGHTCAQVTESVAREAVEEAAAARTQPRAVSPFSAASPRPDPGAGPGPSRPPGACSPGPRHSDPWQAQVSAGGCCSGCLLVPGLLRGSPPSIHGGAQKKRALLRAPPAVCGSSCSASAFFRCRFPSRSSPRRQEGCERLSCGGRRNFAPDQLNR